MYLKRLVLVWALVYSGGAFLEAAEAWPGSDAAFEQSLSSLSFDSIDAAKLLPFKPGSLAGSSEAQFESVLRRNLKFIYHNKLNRRRFLVAPEPQSIVDRIGHLFEVSGRLNELVRSGRFSPESGQEHSFSEFVREIQDSTKELKDEFNDYFVEGYTSTYILKLSSSHDPSTQWALFLLEARKICAELNGRLSEYFLDPAPEAIDLGQFQASSINTLADALLILTESSSKRFPRLR